MADGDPARRAAAAVALEAKPEPEQIALLRAGLRRNDAVATACAKRLHRKWLDVAEQGRVVELLVAALRAGDRDVDFDRLRWMVGSSDLAGILADFPPAPEGWSRRAMLTELHRHVRAEHVPALCRLALGADAPLANAAFENLSIAIWLSDRHRELAAQTLLALEPDRERAVDPDNRHGLAPPRTVPAPRVKNG